MIGWKPKPFIFVHIPKCAGTSIESALIPIMSNHKSFKDFSEEERSQFWLPGNKGLQHRKLRRYEQTFMLDEYFIFGFVRNPWDRAISQIRYLRSVTGKSFFHGDDFKEHVRIYCNTKKNVWGHDLGACQLDYFKDLSGEVRVDFVGRFESLSNDFRMVCRMLGIVNVPNLPHIFNSKQSRHYAAYYDDESAGWIRNRFAKDVKYFGYKFEEPGE
jgi:hypothetical protein